MNEHEYAMVLSLCLISFSFGILAGHYPNVLIGSGRDAVFAFNPATAWAGALLLCGVLVGLVTSILSNVRRP